MVKHGRGIVPNDSPWIPCSPCSPWFLMFPWIPCSPWFPHAPHGSPMALQPEQGEFLCKLENQTNHWAGSIVIEVKGQRSRFKMAVCLELVWNELGPLMIVFMLVPKPLQKPPRGGHPFLVTHIIEYFPPPCKEHYLLSVTSMTAQQQPCYLKCLF